MSAESFTFESKSQSPEAMEAALRASGFSSVAVEEVPNETTPPPPPPVEAPPLPPVEPPAPPPVEPPVAEEPPKPSDSQKRKSRLVRKLTAAEEALAAANAETARLARELAEARRPAPVAAPPPPPEPAFEEKPYPKYEDFANAEDQHAAFTQAVSKHAVEEYERKREHKQSIETAKRKQEDDAKQLIIDAAKARWTPKIEAVKKKFSDYDEVLKKNGNTPTSPLMDYELDAMPNGAEVQYWLASHPEECERIAKLTKTDPKTDPTAAALCHRLVIREFAKIEDEVAKLSPAPTIEEEEEEDLEEAPPVAPPAAPPAPKPGEMVDANGNPITGNPIVATPPPAPAPLAPAPPKVMPKPESMPRPVGSRGSSHAKTIEQMSPDEVKALSADEYRRLRGM